MIKQPALYDAKTGKLSGSGVSCSIRKIGDLKGVYLDEEARSAMDQNTVAYKVYMQNICGEVEGGLFFGVSHVYPGKVGNEYFMTKGHIHAIRNRGEYYWGLGGHGILLLMNEDRHTWAEHVFPGSLHYIAGHVGHRLINTGDEILIVGACWPSDAGHDYNIIQQSGFGLRVMEREGKMYFWEDHS